MTAAAGRAFSWRLLLLPLVVLALVLVEGALRDSLQPAGVGRGETGPSWEERRERPPDEARAAALEARLTEVEAGQRRARREWQRGRPHLALESVVEALTALRGLHQETGLGELEVGFQLRTASIGLELRHLEIELLITLAEAEPEAGFDARAFAAFAGLLSPGLDALQRARRGEVILAPELRREEERLAREIRRADERRKKLAGRRCCPGEVAGVERELTLLLARYGSLIWRIDDRYREGPRLAEHIVPARRLLEGVQAGLDADVLLLAYYLGPEMSYLWRVDAGSIRGHRLPPGPVVERLAGEVSRAIFVARDDRVLLEEVWGRARLLSKVLFDPVAAEIEGKTLAVLSNGNLNGVPLTALPHPRAALAERPAATDAEITWPRPLLLSSNALIFPPAGLLRAFEESAEQGGPALAPLPSALVIADPAYDPRDRRYPGILPAPGLSPSFLIPTVPTPLLH